MFRKTYMFFVFFMIYAPRMGHSNTICMSTLFVANAYLPSYVPIN